MITLRILLAAACLVMVLYNGWDGEQREMALWAIAVALFLNFS